MYYKNLGQEELWLDCAEKLTAMIQNIIEFAKLIPGFMRLSQDDQVSWSIRRRSRLLITFWFLLSSSAFINITFKQTEKPTNQLRFEYLFGLPFQNSISLCPVKDPAAEDGLLRAGDRAHVETDGPVAECRPVRGRHVTARSLLHVGLAGDETGCIYL